MACAADLCGFFVDLKVSPRLDSKEEEDEDVPFSNVVSLGCRDLDTDLDDDDDFFDLFLRR